MSRDANKKRLALLKQNLVDELKSDSPGLLYIKDLEFSIIRLEKMRIADAMAEQWRKRGKIIIE